MLSNTHNQSINSLNTLSPLEQINNSLPEFLSLYNVAAICRESQMLPQKSLLNQDAFSCFELRGNFEGQVNIYKEQALKFKEDMMIEAINILLGHMVSKLEKQQVFCKLSAPKSHIPVDTNKNDIEFSIRYSIDNTIIKDNIVLNFSLKRNF